MDGRFYRAGGMFINPEMLKQFLQQDVTSSAGNKFNGIAGLIGSLSSVLSRDFTTTYEDSALEMSGSDLTRKAMSQSKHQTNQAIQIVGQVLISLLSLVI